MRFAPIATAALILTAGNGDAFETEVRVVSATPGRGIVNEPYQSCPTDGQQACHPVEHYDVRTMYTVVYEYQGQRFSAQLPYDPGPELRVDVAVEPN